MDWPLAGRGVGQCATTGSGAGLCVSAGAFPSLCLSFLPPPSCLRGERKQRQVKDVSLLACKVKLLKSLFWRKKDYLYSVLNSVADPDSVPFWPLNPGCVKNQDPGSGMNNPDHISVSLKTIFGLKILKFFDHISESLETISWVKNTNIPWSGSGIRNLFDPGSGMEDFLIRDKHPGSATLVPNTASTEAQTGNFFAWCRKQV